MNRADITEDAWDAGGESDIHIMSCRDNLVDLIRTRSVRSILVSHRERVELGCILNIGVMNDDCVASVDNHSVRSKRIMGFPEDSFVEGQRSIKQIEVTRLRPLVASSYAQAKAGKSSNRYRQQANYHQESSG